MKITNLWSSGTEYSSNVFLVTGSWNTLTDVNTLVDVGRDPAIIPILLEASTGVGKKRVEQVILTHSHYDHASLLPVIVELFDPVVYAASHALEGVDIVLSGGEKLKLGDREFEVIRAPGHSSDSICLFCEEDGVLFAGDSPLQIRSPEGTYEPAFVFALETIGEKNISSIYFGHGPPLLERCNETLRITRDNVRMSQKR